MPGGFGAARVLALTNVVPGGSTSVIDTSAAFEGPLFVAVTWYVSAVPAVDGIRRRGLLVIQTSASRATVVAASAPLSAGFGSSSLPIASAWFAITVPAGVAAGTSTVTDTDAVPPDGITPTLHVTTPGRFRCSPGLAEENVTSGGQRVGDHDAGRVRRTVVVRR